MKVIVDADYLIFQATEGKAQKGIQPEFGEALGGVDGYKVPLKPIKARFKRILKELIESLAVEMLPTTLGEITKIKLLFSDPDTNFRYDLYPEYKSKRKGERSPEFYRLRAWALKKYGYVKNIEADDRVADYLHKGWLCVSMDKDIRLGLAGTFYNPHYMHGTLSTNSEFEARKFVLLQTVMGDLVDSIPGIPGVGEKTAIKLLDEHGWDEQGVIASYGVKGLGKEAALLTRRLVDMNQYSKKKGLVLFEWGRG